MAKKSVTQEETAIMNLDTSGNIPQDELGKYDMMDEITKIEQKARVDTGSIKVVEKVDHYNISLWKPWGQRVGPMHRTNAIAALKRYAGIGVRLSVTQPTQEQLDDYAASPEGKKRLAAFNASRDLKDKSRKKGAIERMAVDIAKSSGQAVDAVNRLLDAPITGAAARANAGVK